jgi:hypothetical protein
MGSVTATVIGSADAEPAALAALLRASGAEAACSGAIESPAPGIATVQAAAGAVALLGVCTEPEAHPARRSETAVFISERWGSIAQLGVG